MGKAFKASVRYMRNAGNIAFVLPIHPITFTRLSTEPIDLHLFLDRSIIEVFVNKQVFLPKYIYATENRTGVSIMADGTDAKISSFKAWQMVAEMYKPNPE